MILKIASQDVWVVVPDIGRAKYGGPESKKWGFYIYKNEDISKCPVEVVVQKTRAFFDVEEFYYPHDDAILVKASDCYGDPEKITIVGRSESEVATFGLSEDEVHEEDVIFMSWFLDYESGNVYVFDLAYLLNDNGKTIDRIS